MSSNNSLPPSSTPPPSSSPLGLTHTSHTHTHTHSQTPYHQLNDHENENPSEVTDGPPSPSHSLSHLSPSPSLLSSEMTEKDNSPEAKRSRFRLFIRAVVGECFATFMFIFIICAVAANPQNSPPLNLLAGGFAGCGVIFAFSNISGAHLNPAVSWSIWLTGHTSNRKFIGYLLAQFIGAQFAMIGIYCINDSVETVKELAIPVLSTVSLWSVFFTEMFTTFILVSVVFAVVVEDVDEAKKSTMSFKGIAHSKGLTIYSATPQSKLGFAPLTIGVTIGALSACGGASGSVFNPIRIIAPIVWGGTTDYFYIMIIGELVGAAAAGFTRLFFVKFAVAEAETTTRKTREQREHKTIHIKHTDIKKKNTQINSE